MKTYSFLDTTILVNGVPVAGWSDNSNVITATRLEDSRMHKMGADGVMHIYTSNNRAGEITFRLMSTSDSNTFLSSLATSSDFGGEIPVAITVRNSATGETIQSTAGYIKRPADINTGREVTEREWSFVVEDLILFN